MRVPHSDRGNVHKIITQFQVRGFLAHEPEAEAPERTGAVLMASGVMLEMHPGLCVE